jgi:hypothetical protein
LEEAKWSDGGRRREEKERIRKGRGREKVRRNDGNEAKDG